MSYAVLHEHGCRSTLAADTDKSLLNAVKPMRSSPPSSWNPFFPPSASPLYHPADSPLLLTAHKPDLLSLRHPLLYSHVTTSSADKRTASKRGGDPVSKDLTSRWKARNIQIKSSHQYWSHRPRRPSKLWTVLGGRSDRMLLHSGTLRVTNNIIPTLVSLLRHLSRLIYRESVPLSVICT